jgi:hypothetical protein
MRYKERGFALLGLALAILIASLLVIASINQNNNNFGQSRNTTKKLTDIKNALTSYALANGYFPCPASLTEALTNSTFASESRADATSCTTGSGVSLVAAGTVYHGLVPIKTLGLPNDLSADEWGNKIEYYVPSDWIDATDNAIPAPLPEVITLTDGVGRNVFVPFVVISRGKNGYYAYPLGRSTANSVSSDPEEIQNTAGNSFIIFENIDGFDDLLMYITNLKLGDLNTNNQ